LKEKEQEETPKGVLGAVVAARAIKERKDDQVYRIV